MVTRQSCHCRAVDVLFAGLGLGPVLLVLVVGSGLLGSWTNRLGEQVLVEEYDVPPPLGGNVTTILYYTMWFENVVASLSGYERKTCPGHGGAALECAFTSNKRVLDQADVVVFHARDLELAKMPAARPFASQLWAYWSEENPLYDHRSCGWYFRFKWWERQCDKVSLDPERLALFDLRMGYQLWSEVVVSYVHPSLKQYTDRPSSPSWQERKNAVVWIANNCASFNKREKYIAAFMKHYPVHSYGDCLRTMPGKEGKVSEEEVMKLMSQYKFAFAWENANCDDYVTEKLMHVFISGGLPIVDGPDDYSPFVPNNHSVIRVSDFAGPKALADHLRRLEKDQALYESYFTYKPPTSHYDPAFLAADLGQDIGCKLCREAAQRRAEPHASGRRKVQLDASCTRRRWDREYYDDGTMSSGPVALWIEEWGFGSEDLVLWALGIGGVLASLLLARMLRQRRRLQRSPCLFLFK